MVLQYPLQFWLFRSIRIVFRVIRKEKLTCPVGQPSVKLMLSESGFYLFRTIRQASLSKPDIRIYTFCFCLKLSDIFFVLYLSTPPISEHRSALRIGGSMSYLRSARYTVVDLDLASRSVRELGFTK